MTQKISISLLLILIIILFFAADIFPYFSLESLKVWHYNLHNYYNHNPLFFIVIFFICYVVIASLSLPGATLLTLLSGAVFDVVIATMLVSFASSLGATFAFLISRFFLNEWVEKKYPHKIKIVNKGIKEEGGFYLFALRLAPLFPFFLVNLIMGITKISIKKFYLITQIGMLPTIFIYIYAGNKLSHIHSFRDILSIKLFFALLLLGLLPLIMRRILIIMRKEKIYKKDIKISV